MNTKDVVEYLFRISLLTIGGWFGYRLGLAVQAVRSARTEAAMRVQHAKELIQIREAKGRLSNGVATED